VARWIDLVDPDKTSVRSVVPGDVVDAVVEQLAHRPTSDDRPLRPRLEAHGSYVWGVLLAAVVERERDRVYYQEVDVVLTEDLVVTVRKTPAGGEAPFDPMQLREACKTEETPRPGLLLYYLIDEVADRYLDLVDDLNAEIDEVEDAIERRPASEIRYRLSELRHDLLSIRRTLGPTRDAVRAVADDRIELEARRYLIEKRRLFPREVDLQFFGAYDKILRAYDGLELSRDLVAGARDYLQTKIANDQNEVTKRLTAIASILLFPTFVVGVYGQNFDNIPELHWRFGYLLSWAVVIVATAAQVIYFRRRRWL
jgi:magnesium transporter